VPELVKYGENLNKIFHKRTAISVSANTNKKIFTLLDAIELHYTVQERATGFALGDNIRSAFTKGLEGSSDYFYFIDFDRALHWTKRFPDELMKVIKLIQNTTGYVSMVRTRRAFETHPLIQRSTETTINAIASQVVKTTVDIMSGSFAVDRSTAELLVKKTTRDDFGIYAQMLEVARIAKKPISTIEVDGLEWETPDQFQKKIQQEGYEAWLQSFESLPEWQKRVQLIASSAEELLP
jgi:hypothetical protein